LVFFPILRQRKNTRFHAAGRSNLRPSRQESAVSENRMTRFVNNENLLQKEAKMMTLEKLIAQREGVSNKPFPVPVRPSSLEVEC
jgi:hypothetical protein